MALDLKGKQLEALRGALLSAFPSWSDLDAMVAIELDESLEAIVGRGSMKAVTLELVRWAQSRSRVDALLAGSLRQNATNEDLRRVAYELSLSSDSLPAPDLEAIVIPSVGFENTAQWRQRMDACERRVCRIEVQTAGGTWAGIGTGSLVASDLVLTNTHVADGVQGSAAGRAQFDFSVDASGAEQAGRCADLASSWLVWSSPVKELDFALVRLAEHVGRDTVTGGTRGWLSLRRHAFRPNEPVILLQHPNAERLKIAVGSITETLTSPPRVHYTANTLRGSSGSPCFTMGWELVAIHRAGPHPHANEGVPAAAILEALAANGMLGLLDGAGAAAQPAPVAKQQPPPAPRKIFISYRRQGEEAAFATRLHEHLERQGHSVFRDVTMSIGTDWAKEISRNIADSDAFVVVMSEESIAREMVQAEVREAYQQQRRTGKPRILPIRFGYTGPLDYEIDCYVGRLHYAKWSAPSDDASVFEHVARGIEEPASEALRPPLRKVASVTLDDRPIPSMDPRILIVPGGTMAPEHPLYIRRRADDEVDALAKLDEPQTLIIRGPRQSGKSSLLTRYLASCQAKEKRIAFVDFQMFGDELDTYPGFLTALAAAIFNELELDGPEPKITTQPEMIRFVTKTVLKRPVVLAFDEVDRVSGREYKTDFFTMLRLWHNNRSHVVHRQWRLLDLALVISTEPEFLIETGDRSPFNVGHRVRVESFTRDECHELNARYGARALPGAQVDELHELLGGHPYLMRVAFHHAVSGTLDLRAAADPFGPFGDHLRAMLSHLTATPVLLKGLQELIHRRTADQDVIERLRGAGLVKLDGRVASPANLLYARFFRSIR